MKSSFLRVIFAVLIVVFTVSGCSSGVPGNVDRMNTFQLMTAAAAARSAGRIEDAGFLMLAGQARYQIDKQVFPPVGKGGDSPGVLAAALGASIGQGLQSDMGNDPVAFANAVARLSKWSPEIGNGYDPGWEYQNHLSDQAAAAVVTATLKPALSAAQSKAKLVQNEEYVRLSLVVKEAGAVERKYSAALQQGKGIAPKDILNEYNAAMERKNTAAKRMKEIEFEISPESRWHAQVGWKAKDYFDDPQVIELCHAIESNDVAEMERLIATGAKVNTVGHGGMTPLLWAFPDRKLERFECLLKHGANPNETIGSDFGVGNRPFHPYPAGGSFFLDRGSLRGKSVTHLAARSPEIKYLRLVMEHGGDPNVADKDTGMTPLDIVLDREFYSNIHERVELLIAKGANLNHYCQYKRGTPTMLAVLADRYAVALALLEAGADPKLYQPDGTEKLIHIVARMEERKLKDFQPPLQAEFQSVVDWLEAHGESLGKAREEQKQWNEQIQKAGGWTASEQIRAQIIQDQLKEGRKDAPVLQ